MKWRNLTVLSASAAFGVLSIGCERDASPEMTDTASIEETSTGATATSGADADSILDVADITGSPERYLGQTVTVVAEVEEVLGPYSFKLDEGAVLAGGIDNDLRVFWSNSASLAAIDDQWLNDNVRVTGTVARMTVTELEREIGWDLDPELEAEVEGTRPVLIARSVQRVDGT